MTKIWGVTVWAVCTPLIPMRSHPQSYPIEQSVSPFLRARVNQSLQGCTSLKHPPLCSTIGSAFHLGEVSSLDLRYHLISPLMVKPLLRSTLNYHFPFVNVECVTTAPLGLLCVTDLIAGMPAWQGNPKAGPLT